MFSNYKILKLSWSSLLELNIEFPQFIFVSGKTLGLIIIKHIWCSDSVFFLLNKYYPTETQKLAFLCKSLWKFITLINTNLNWEFFFSATKLISTAVLQEILKQEDLDKVFFVGKPPEAGSKHGWPCCKVT